MRDPLHDALPGLPAGREVLFQALLAAAAPLDELTISQWADRHRVVSAESGSPFPGPWSTDRVPHLREPMDCLHPDHPAREVSLKWSAQVGKTEIIVNWFGFIVDRAPGSMMIMLPSLDEAIKFNRVKLQPTIDASPKIRHRVAAENSRDEAASTTSFKRFAGGFAQIVTASSSKGLQMVSIRYMARDEISEYPLDTDGRGDPLDQSDARQKAYGDLAKKLNTSTPGLAGQCRISAKVEAGDRRRRYLPCPHCGDYQVLAYENMVAPSAATRQRACFACISCGSLIDQASRDEMFGNGRWIATRVRAGEPKVPDVIKAAQIDRWTCAPCEGRCRGWEPSYLLWAAYSTMESWTEIWKRGEAAKANPIKMKSFVQQDLGEAYEAASDAPQWEKLHGAREPFPARVVPYPAAVLTGFIDVQGDRLEWAVWAWGPRAEGWIIDRGVIPFPHALDEAWTAVDALVAKTYPTTGGAEIPVDLWGMDTGDDATDLYLRLRGRNHRLVACKGANKPSAIPITTSMVPMKDRRGKTVGKIALNHIGNFGLKSRIYQGLANLVAGRDASGRFPPETLHLCAEIFDEVQCRQITAEVLVDPREEAKGKARRALLQKAQDRREWMKKPGARNEALDIVVGCRALAFALGIDSYSPEQWARIWRERSIEPAAAPDLFEAQPGGPAAPTPRLFGLSKRPGAPARPSMAERLARLNRGS